MSGNQSNNIINEAKRLIDNVDKMIALHTEVMEILMKYYSFYNYERIKEFKEKASEKVKDALETTKQALELIKSESKSGDTSKKKDETSITTGGSSGRSRRSRVKKSTVQYEIDDILTGGYWKEMKKKK